MAWVFVLLQSVLPQHLISRLIGKIASTKLALVRTPLIHLFILVFKVDMSEADESNFASFNDFFVRALKPNSRPICQEPGALVSPADGKVSELGRIGDAGIFQAKGLMYSLEDLLARPADALEHFHNGSFATVYLAPNNYHRVHAPLSATLLSARYLPGRLFSVNPTTTMRVPNLFARNERLVMEFNTEFGAMAVIMVGAMIVAGIKSAWREDIYPPGLPTTDNSIDPIDFQKGEELGQFRFGSTVIVLTTAHFNWTVRPGGVVWMGARIGALES